MKALAIIGCIIGGVVAVAGMTIWWAYALSVLWAWFIVPLGVKSLTVAHAYGVSVVMGMFLGTRGIKENKNQDDWISAVVTWIIYPTCALFFGWIALGFM